MATDSREIQRKFEDLKPDQQAQLNAFLAELDTIPLPERLVRCLEITGVDPTVETELATIDSTMAGAWAYDRMLLYLDRLRALNEERKRLGEAARRFREHSYPTTESELNHAARARVMAPHIAGMQEITVNFFCVSVQHIRSLLLIVAERIGYDIPPDDLQFLDEFRVLRNHFEHWYSRLPGKIHERALITKTLTANGYHIKGGLGIDDQDRFIVMEPKKSGPVRHVVDVTDEGVARVERIVRTLDEKCKEILLEQVRAHLIANPSHIPDIECLRWDLHFGVGGHGHGIEQ